MSDNSVFKQNLPILQLLHKNTLNRSYLYVLNI